MNSLNFDELWEALQKDEIIEKYMSEMIHFKKYVNELGNISYSKPTMFKNARQQKEVKEMVDDIFEDIEL